MKRAIYTLIVVAVVVSFTMLIDSFKSSPDGAFRVEKIELLPVVSDSVTHHEEMSAFLLPYTERLTLTMDEVIGYASDDLLVDMPESGMTRFVADVMMKVASKSASVDVAISNIGGIRAPIFKGDISVGDVFSTLPFDNALVLVTLRGTTLDSLVHAIVVKGGAAVSGSTFSYEQDGLPSNIMVGGKLLDGSKIYTVVTNDYLSFGNDGFGPLSNFISLTPLNITLRDAMLTYIRNCTKEKKSIVAPSDIRFPQFN